MKKLISILLLLGVGSIKAHASHIWGGGFELGNLAMEVNTITGAGAVINSDPAFVRSGSYSFKSSATAGVAELLHKPIADSETTAYLSMSIYLATASSGLVGILGYEDSSGFIGGNLRMNADRTLECWEDTAQVGSDSSAIPLATWTRVAFKFDDILNVVDCQINGVSFASGAATDLAGGGQISIGFQSTISGVMYIDDIFWNNAGGATPNNTFATTEKLVHLHPNGAGDTTTATGIGGSAPAATIWESVDEVTPDDAVTVATMTLNTSLFDVAFEAASVGGIGSEDTVSFVAASARRSSAGTGGSNCVPRIFSQSLGVKSTGTAVVYATASWFTHDDTAGTRIYNLISQTDPQTGTAWTSARIDGMQIEYAASDATPNIYISKVWAMVAFIDNAAAGGRRIMNIP